MANLQSPTSNEPFDIILMTHNMIELTIKAINAIYTYTATPFHLIVVDDSVDLTPLYMEKLKEQHDNVTFIHSNKPYESGNQVTNIGLEAAKHEIVVSMGNSVTVEPHWEKVALQFIKEHPDVGVVGIKLLMKEGLIEEAGVIFEGHKALGIGYLQPGHRLTGIYECEAIQWACAFLRKKAIGKLEEDVYYGWRGWEDLDNCFVARKNGWKVYYCGYGVAYHESRATRGSNTPQAMAENAENTEFFYKRWGLWDEYMKATNKPQGYTQGINKASGNLQKIKQEVK